MTAAIGHNSPPASEAFAMAINDLFAEAKNFLDGQPIENQQQADALGDILTGMKELVRDAEKTRKAEKQPHIDAGKAVDDRWKAVKAPAELTIAEATKPLTVWRTEQQRIADEKAKRLREEAAADLARAQAARESATSLEDAEHAEAILKGATIAQRTANKIDRAPTGLRTTWDAQVLDYGALLKWMKAKRQDDLMEFLNTFAQRNVEIAKAGNMPGVVAQQIRKAA